MFTNHSKTGALCVFIILFSLTTANANKCLYTVSHRSGEVQMFEMDGTQLILQKETHVENHGFGAIDMAIDLNSSTLFICFEEDIYTSESEGNIIELLDSRNLEPYAGVEGLSLEGPTDITGLEYDSDRELLFCTDRNTNYLWVYDWDAETFTLTPDPNSPIELDNIDYACGLARNGDTLYVSEHYYVLRGSGIPYQAVQSYDLDDNYNYLGAIGMGNDTIGIAYSETDNAIYGGAFRNSDYLIKRVVDPNSIIQKDINAYINGVAVNNDTGLVYVTTQRGTVEVYNTSGWASDPNEEAKPVFAYDADDPGMAGIEVGDTYKPPLMTISKTDNLADPNAYVEPNSIIHYTISYAPDPNDHYNVVVTDYLPVSVDFLYADPNSNGVFDPFTRSYSWDIGYVEGNAAEEELEIYVQVNQLCNPTGQIENRVDIESDTSYTIAYEYTPVGCWGGDRIYVNVNATGSENGVTWTNAYTDLQDALTRAGVCGYQNNYKIWVARGTYRPGNSTTASFVIPDNVDLYGGFNGWETTLEERNYTQNKTILNGYAGLDNYSFKQYAQKVVTMGDETVLDGFIIEEASQYGIYGLDDDFTISNCNIINSSQWGIYCQNCDATINWCTIKNNGTFGIDHFGSGYILTVNNCMIYDNKQNGIVCDQSIPTILNSVIHHNASDISDGYGNTYHGIRLYQPSGIPEIRNNTIVYNSNEGIYFTGTNDPLIDNCILWGNDENDGYFQFYNCLPYNSCYFDPNDPNSSSTPDEYGNIKCDPIFAYSDPDNGNFHLSFNSPCKDMGNSNLVGLEELDIDGFDRIYEPNVDMGADEVDCEDVYNPLDWAAADGLVNMREFATLSAAWLSCDPNSYDPNLGYTTENWNPVCDLTEDNMVDIDDLVVFCYDWLWTACWLDTEQMFYMMAPSGGESMSLSSSAFSAASLTAEESYTEPIPLCSVEEMTAWLEDIYNDNEEFQLGYSAQEWQEFIDLVRDSWPSP